MHHALPVGGRYLLGLGFFERFGLYAARALLILFVTMDIVRGDFSAMHVYTGLMVINFMTPLFAGWLSDNFWGNQQSIRIGIFFMIAGMFALFFGETWAFYSGLSALVIGSGMVRVNTLVLFGKLYPKNSDWLDVGFTYFYAFSSLGAMIAWPFCALISTYYGLEWGFFLGAILMMVSLMVFYKGRIHYGYHGVMPTAPLLKNISLKAVQVFFYAAIVLLVPVVAFLIVNMHFLSTILPVVMVFSLAVILYIAFVEGYKKEMIGLFVLLFFSVFFVALFEQAHVFITLFSVQQIDSSLDLTFGAPLISKLLGGVTGAAHNMYAPFFAGCAIVVGSFVLGHLWARLIRRRRSPMPTVKVAIGFGFAALGFVALSYSNQMSDGANTIDFFLWGIAMYIFYTIGELCVIPTGYAAVTRLSSSKFGTLMMGIWIFAFSAAQWIDNLLLDYLGITVRLQSTTCGIETYCDAFGMLGWIAFGAGFILLILSPFLRKCYR